MESELVSGFMTEHAAVIFVFFFLAEYASIVLICVLTSVLFLGGYLFNYSFLYSLYLMLIEHINFDMYLEYKSYDFGYFFKDPLIEGLIYGLTLGLKSCIMIFIFI